MREFHAEKGADGYDVTVWGGGLSMLIRHNGAEVHLQGEEAGLAYDEYCDLAADHNKPNTRASRFTWAELLDQMFGCYFY